MGNIKVEDPTARDGGAWEGVVAGWRDGADYTTESMENSSSSIDLQAEHLTALAAADALTGAAKARSRGGGGMTIISLEQAEQRVAGSPAHQRPLRRLPVLLYEEIEASTDTADFVEGLLIDGGVSVFYGASNSGKTFFICDIGFHVALGWPWHGRQVERGGVVYVAGEGGVGIKNRVAAFKAHHGAAASGDVPFAVIPTVPDLRDTADVALLIASVREMADYSGIPVRLVVIDTVSRALAGGDENTSSDMGALVRNVDRIRAETGAHVALVHHSGKDSARGARGHSLLRAAIDTEIEVARDHGLGISVATVTKQRDLPMEGEVAFKLRVVELGNNRRGKSVTSCVVVPTDEERTEASRKPPMTGGTRVALDALRKAINAGGAPLPTSNHVPPNVQGVSVDIWRNYAYASDISSGDQGAKKKAFQRAVAALQTRNLIGTWEGWVWII